MTNYSLKLPIQLQKKAEKFATDQGVSLNEFILWAVAEKVGELSQQFDIGKFPDITYRRGASGELVPVLRGIGLRVQVIAIANQKWGLSTTSFNFSPHLRLNPPVTGKMPIPQELRILFSEK